MKRFAGSVLAGLLVAQASHWLLSLFGDIESTSSESGAILGLPLFGVFYVISRLAGGFVCCQLSEKSIGAPLIALAAVDWLTSVVWGAVIGVARPFDSPEMMVLSQESSDAIFLIASTLFSLIGYTLAAGAYALSKPRAAGRVPSSPRTFRLIGFCFQTLGFVTSVGTFGLVATSRQVFFQGTFVQRFPIIFVMFLLFSLGGFLFRTGNRFQIAAQPIPKESPDVVVFRSFQDDQVEFAESGFGFSSLLKLKDRNFLLKATQELRNKRRVAAIGNPRDTLPHWAAGWFFFDDTTWQDAARRFIREANAVFMVIGRTDNLALELSYVVELGALQKTLFVLPPDGLGASSWQTRWDSFRATLKTLQINGLPDEVPSDGIVLRVTSAQPLHVYASRKRTEKAYRQQIEKALNDVPGWISEPAKT